MHFQAAARRHTRERDLVLFGAWHGEAFQRTKKLPPLTDVLSRPPGRRQTAEEMKAAMLDIFAARRRAKG